MSSGQASRHPQSRMGIGFAMLTLAVLALWYIMTTPGLKPVVIAAYGPPEVYVENRVLDVGQVETDSQVRRVFLIYNKGGQHLRISDVDASCGCTVTEVDKKVVAPGDFTRLKVDMDTSLKLGKTRKTITVRSNDPKRPELLLFLTGEVMAKKMQAHGMPVMLKPKDRLVLFKGECASCHVARGKGKTGKDLFLADCAMCHGMNGQGTPSSGPSLLAGNYDDPGYEAYLRAIIANGSPKSPQMPPFSAKNGGPLNDDEIDSLVRFLTFQAARNKMGLLETTDTAEEENEAAFLEALQEPH